MTQTAVTQFNPDQLKLVRETVAKGTNEAEFRLFIEVCKYHGLNPFARQIYAVVREGYQGRQLTIQTSIDGYRLLAERSGKYSGQVGPEWCGDDGKWVDVWLSDSPPAAARVGVLRKDFTQPTWGVAKYKSYAQTKKDGSPMSMWSKMPDVMLAKCAESLALRKAFPAEMSGIYTKEEVDQAENDLPTIALNGHAPMVEADVPAQPSEQQLNSIRILATQPVQLEPEITNLADQPMNSGQLAGIKDLCSKLGREVPADVQTLDYLKAKSVIQMLTSEWNVAKSKLKKSS